MRGDTAATTVLSVDCWGRSNAYPKMSNFIKCAIQWHLVHSMSHRHHLSLLSFITLNGDPKPINTRSCSPPPRPGCHPSSALCL